MLANLIGVHKISPHSNSSDYKSVWAGLNIRALAHLLRFLLAAASSEDDELALEDMVVAAAAADAVVGVACNCCRSSMAATRLLPALAAGIGVFGTA